MLSLHLCWMDGCYVSCDTIVNTWLMQAFLILSQHEAPPAGGSSVQPFFRRLTHSHPCSLQRAESPLMRPCNNTLQPGKNASLVLIFEMYPFTSVLSVQDQEAFFVDLVQRVIALLTFYLIKCRVGNTFPKSTYSWNHWPWLSGGGHYPVVNKQSVP